LGSAIQSFMFYTSVRATFPLTTVDVPNDVSRSQKRHRKRAMINIPRPRNRGFFTFGTGIITVSQPESHLGTGITLFDQLGTIGDYKGF